MLRVNPLLPAAQASRGPSPNIKPKKKVAALFGAPVPESAEH